MTQRQKALLSCAVAAALLLSGCRKGSSDSGSMSSSNAMSGSSGSASTTQTGGWKTGLGILTEASDEARTGTIHTIAAAVLLDGDGKLADVMLDELEVEVTADGKGVVTMPTDYRTKRQKGDDYPLAAASSLKKGWAEQADDFADYLTGMTPEQASMLETDKDGKATDADLLSGCTIRVDQYRDAVAKACTNASALGAAKGDRVSLGVEAENASSDITATDDKDVNAEVDLTVVALLTGCSDSSSKTKQVEECFRTLRKTTQNVDYQKDETLDKKLEVIAQKFQPSWLDNRTGGLTEDARTIIKNELGDYLVSGSVWLWYGEVEPGQSAQAQAESMKRDLGIVYGGGTLGGGTLLTAIAFTRTDKKSDGRRYYLALVTYATVKTPQN